MSTRERAPSLLGAGHRRSGRRLGDDVHLDLPWREGALQGRPQAAFGVDDDDAHRLLRDGRLRREEHGQGEPEAGEKPGDIGALTFSCDGRGRIGHT